MRLFYICLIFHIFSGAHLQGQMWEDTIDGYAVMIPDISRPVRAAYVTFASRLFDNSDIRDLCGHHNIVMMENRISNSSPGFSWAKANEILDNLTFLSNHLAKPEIRFAPLILTGLSASGARSTFMAYVPQLRERILALVVNNQPYYYGPPEIPQLFLIAGRDGFGSYGYNLEYLSGPSKYMATVDKMPFTIAVMPYAEHHRPHEDQSFTSVWLDAVIRLRAPMIPSEELLPLTPFHDHQSWIGTFEAGKSNQAPFSDSHSRYFDKIEEAMVYPYRNYPGDKPYIWLPDECSALAWQEFSDTGFLLSSCDCEIGAECNDGDECTVNDRYDENCNCIGELVDENNDGICDLFNCIPGNLCDDNIECTDFDQYDNRCNCRGTWTDSDKDGICDEDDMCPGRWDRLIGTYCDVDISGNTTGTYNENCECVTGCPHAGTPCVIDDPEVKYAWYNYDCECIEVIIDRDVSVNILESPPMLDTPKLQPNPFNNVLIVQSNTQLGEDLIINIWNMNGKLTSSRRLHLIDSVEIDTYSLAPGMYVVELVCQRYSKKFKMVKFDGFIK